MSDLAALKEHYGVREWGRRAPLAVRLLRRVVEDPSGCWLWGGGKVRDGYGLMYAPRPGRSSHQPVHRVAYELLAGAIPAGLHLDHLCRVPSCVNPAHLEPVTNRENCLRGVSPAALNARKTECANGHPLSAENTRLTATGRVCRPCGRAERLERYHAGRIPSIRDDRHGTLTNYGYGCRCDLCRRAGLAYNRAYRARKAAERAA